MARRQRSAARPAPAGATLPVAVVVVTWNSAASIAACLASAQAQRPAEIWVVDNASADSTLAQVARFAGVQVVAHAHNHGFAAACNAGIAASRAPFVLLLNDDATLRPGYLAHTVAALQAAPRAATATGKLLLPTPPGVPPCIDSAGIRLDRYALRPLDEGHGERDRGQYDGGIARIFGPSGAAALLRRTALQALPGAPLDAALFAYYEDVDLAWRLRRAGWHHLRVPAAVAEHGRRGPGAKPPAIAARAFVNRYTVWRRNEPWWRFAPYAPVALAWEAARLVRLGLREPFALLDALRGAPAAWRRGGQPPRAA